MKMKITILGIDLVQTWRLREKDKAYGRAFFTVVVSLLISLLLIAEVGFKLAEAIRTGHFPGFGVYEDLFLIAILFFTWRILRNFYNGKVFVESTFTSLAAIGLLCILFPLLVEDGSGGLIKQLLDFVPYKAEEHTRFSNNYIMLGIVFTAVADLLRSGVKLQQDQDLTI